MLNRAAVFVLLGAMALLAAPPSPKPKGDGELPEELLQVAKELGCGPVPGFYNRPGMVDPPYLYGYLPGNKEETAAFWCYREQEEKPYLLVFVEFLGYDRTGRAASTIPWQNYPGGLSLFNIQDAQLYDSEGTAVTDSQHLPLSLFRYVDHPKEYGPKAKTTKYAPLEDYYDGALTLFYRDGDRWLFLMID